MNIKTKLNFILLFSFLFLGLTSCKKDCAAPDASENIVGIWVVESDGEEVEFKSDGTLIDPNNSIFYMEIWGVEWPNKTYLIEGTTLKLMAWTVSGGGPASTSREIKLNECDEVKFGFSFGSPETLSRK